MPTTRRLLRPLFFSVVIAAFPFRTVHGASVDWAQDADGDWQTAGNWSPGVPSIVDDVTIDVGTMTNRRTITHSQALNDTILSLDLNENLSVTAGAILVLNDVTLRSGTTLTVSVATFGDAGTGTTVLDAANLFAISGGSIPLLAATSYTGGIGMQSTLEANGPSSGVLLSSLTSFVGASNGRVTVQALNGGEIDLSNVTTLNGTTSLQAIGAESVVRLDKATDINGIGVTDGVKLVVADGGTINLPMVDSLTAVSAFAEDGLTLDLSSATSYAGTFGANNTIEADGMGSRVDLTGLSMFSGVNNQNGRVTVQALNGGEIDLSNVTTLNGTTSLQAIGAESVVRLDKATDINGIGVTDGVKLVVADGGTINLNPGTTMISNSVTIDSRTGTTTVGTLNVPFESNLSAVGTITGNVNNAGTVNIGTSPGRLTLTGNYSSQSGSQLPIEIGGVVRESGYDTMAVQGSASLAGNLNVSLINGFSPNYAERFEILTANNISGQFDMVSLPSIDGQNLDWKVTQTAKRIELAIVSTTSVGDSGGMPITVDAGGGSGSTGGVTATFDSITEAGTLAIDYNPVDQSVFFQRLSDGEFVFNGVNFFIPTDPFQLWDVSFDGTFTGALTLVFGYDDTALLPEAEQDLFLMHFENNEWMPLSGTVDEALNTITVSLSSLSPLALASTTIPGDYNNDGAVNLADYTVWRDNLGGTAVLPGDTTPGMVTQDDYTVWKANFGTTSPSPSSVAFPVAPVPEPVMLQIVLLVTIAEFSRRRAVSW